MDAYPEADAADASLLQRLRAEVDRQISDYIYVALAGAVGVPWSESKVRAELDFMRECLVAPRWEDVRICNGAINDQGVTRRCVLLAEDSDYVLVFEPSDAEYHLAWRGERV